MTERRKLFLLFNHELTEEQERDARVSLQVDRIVDLPDNLKAIWRDIPPDLAGVRDYIKPIMDWLSSHAKTNDYILVQGDFGACYIIVAFAFQKGFIPIYSTTKREAVEERDTSGIVVLRHLFRHVRFRMYNE